MYTILSVLQVFIAVILIFLVLLHSGKDAGMSGAFGVGVAGGSTGGSLMERNLDRWTILFAVLFAANTIALLKSSVQTGGRPATMREHRRVPAGRRRTWHGPIVTTVRRSRSAGSRRAVSPPAAVADRLGGERGGDDARDVRVGGRGRAGREHERSTSPSNAEWTGSTARAIPACAILATIAHSALVSAASVSRQTSVVESPVPRGRAGQLQQVPSG